MEFNAELLEKLQANKQLVEMSELEVRLMLDVITNAIALLDSNKNIDPKYQEPTEFVRIGLHSISNKFKSKFNINSGQGG